MCVCVDKSKPTGESWICRQKKERSHGPIRSVGVRVGNGVGLQWIKESSRITGLHKWSLAVFVSILFVCSFVVFFLLYFLYSFLYSKSLWRPWCGPVRTVFTGSLWGKQLCACLNTPHPPPVSVVKRKLLDQWMRSWCWCVFIAVAALRRPAGAGKMRKRKVLNNNNRQ